MNPVILAFFGLASVASLLAGLRFWSQKDKTLTYFGLGLIMNGLAFAVWTFAIIARPDILEVWVTIGVVPFIISLLAFLASGVQRLESNLGRYVIVLASVGAVGLFLLRTFVLPSHAIITPDGMFFFDPSPLIMVIYVASLGVAGFSAIAGVAARLKDFGDHMIFWTIFTPLVIGGILLLTSQEPVLLYVNGAVMAIAYAALIARYIFNFPKLASKSKD